MCCGMKPRDSWERARLMPDSIINLADEAQRGYARGWRYTPLAGKRPILEQWASRPPATDTETLEWARAGRNLGVRCGSASGIVVLDIDPNNGCLKTPADYPPTVTACTGGGGWHLYYAMPQGATIGNSAKAWNLPTGMDIRGDGGQVVAVGSIHPDTGNLYTWMEGRSPEEIAIAPFPLRKPPPPPPPPPTPLSTPGALPPGYPAPPSMPPPRASVKTVGHAGGTGGREAAWAAKAMQSELAGLQGAVEGTRNHALNAAAFNLGQLVGGGHLERSIIEQSLLGVAVQIGLPESEARKTISSGIGSGVLRPRFAPPERAGVDGALPPPAVGATEREYVLVPGAHVDDSGKYHEIGADKFASSVIDRLPPGTMYRRGNVVGQITGAQGAREFQQIGADHARLIVDAHMELGQWKKPKQEDAFLIFKSCSRDLGSLIVTAAASHPSIRAIDMLVRYPVFRPDGALSPPGWHDGLFYDEPVELVNLTVERDPHVIRDALDDLIIDFPLSDDADRHNFFGMLLTAIVRPMIDKAPLHLVTSPLERVGKSKLVEEVFGGILLGEDLSADQLAATEEEVEKRILSTLLKGDPIWFLDNVHRGIDSASFAALLTSRRYGGRVLGHSQRVTLPNNLTIVGTGNNVHGSGEMVKRSIFISFTPRTDRPEDRNDFVHPDLGGYVRASRRMVLGCLIGMVQNWIAAGRPGSSRRRLGGFEQWSDVVGGVLQHAGFTAWRGNERTWHRIADPEGEDLEQFILRWAATFGTNAVRSKELFDMAVTFNLYGGMFAGKTDHGGAIALSRRVLNPNVNRPVGAWLIRKVQSGSVAGYNLESLNTPKTMSG